MISKIKASLRKSKFYTRYCQRRINDARYFVKNIRYYLRHFSFSSTITKNDNVFYFVFDPSLKHPGLTDRLKVISCMYYIAKTNGFKFKIVYEDPFKLSDYLDCNKVNWIGNISDIDLTWPSTKLYAYNGMAKIPHLSKSVNTYLCVHYIGKNILQCNNIKNWENLWADCFHDLFKPTEALKLTLDQTGYPSRTYISVHFRFVNALENFESGFYNQLSPEKQNELIEKCLKCLRKIKDNNNLPLLIFSDSNRFLSIAKENGYNVLDGNVNHVSFHTDNDTVMKTFTDFFMISRSKKVYRIISKELYCTTFSMYAAISGYCDFETIDLDK